MRGQAGLTVGGGTGCRSTCSSVGSRQAHVGALLEDVHPEAAGAGHRLVRSESPPMLNEVAISFVVTAMANPREKQQPLVLVAISEDLIGRGKAVGVDLNGKSVALDHDGVIHTMRGHSGQNERLRGQEPITAEDIAMFGSILHAAILRAGDPPKARDGAPMLEGAAALGGWLYGFAAKVRRRHVVLHTLFKRHHQ